MKNTSRLAAVTLLATLAVGASSLKVSAANDDPCSFGPKFDRLHAIQTDGSQDYITAIRAQLDVRKSILKSAIDCALKDVTARQEALKNVSPELQDSKTTAEVSQGLEQSAAYYNDKKKIVDNLGIKGTQDVAKEIASWRSANYAPLASAEDNLLLWTQNQGLFDKAASRFQQIKPVVLSLKIVNQDDIQAKFNDAEKNLADAEDRNQSAKIALEKGDTSNAATFVKSSLEPLSSMYKKFMELSDAIKKIVP